MYSGNKIIGDLKNGKIRIFFRIFGANKGSLGVFRGDLGVPNCFVISRRARNCIPTKKKKKKKLAISKTAKIEFFFVFSE